MARAKKKKALKAADIDPGISVDGLHRWMMAGQPSAEDDPEGVWEAFLAMWHRIGQHYATGYMWFVATGESINHQNFGEEPSTEERQAALDEFCWRTGTHAPRHAGNYLRCLWCAARRIRK